MTTLVNKSYHALLLFGRYYVWILIAVASFIFRCSISLLAMFRRNFFDAVLAPNPYLQSIFNRRILYLGFKPTSLHLLLLLLLH